MKRSARFWQTLVWSSFSFITGIAHGQTIQAILQSAATAFSQGKTVNSVTLNASAQWIAGSDKESGNATLTSGADGSFTVQLQLAQSSRTEAQTSFSSGQSCTWAGTGGVANATAAHNCMLSMGWFMPEVSLFGGQQLSSIGTSLVSSAAQQLIDVRQQLAPPLTLDSRTGALLTHISTVDLYLDPTTFLPSILAYNIHPDTNATIDIPVQVTFTNYQTVNGVAIPFTIQRYVNGVLNLALTVNQASTN